jgi:hypothetical protein
MATYLARSECRNGLWYVVTYEISSTPWVELLSVPTPQPCRGNEPPIVIGEPVTVESPKPEDEPGECEGASLNSFSTTWTSTTVYTSVGAEADCPAPSAIAMARGLRDAKERFGEVADEYCLLHECKGDELCLYAGGKLDVSFEGIVSKIVGNEKDCFFKFKMTGELGCTCKPGPKRQPKDKPKPEKPAKKSARKKAARKKTKPKKLSSTLDQAAQKIMHGDAVKRARKR